MRGGRDSKAAPNRAHKGRIGGCQATRNRPYRTTRAQDRRSQRGRRDARRAPRLERGATTAAQHGTTPPQKRTQTPQPLLRRGETHGAARACGNAPPRRALVVWTTAAAAAAADARGRIRCAQCVGGKTGNDPSAGSPTETLLRLLLPLNDKVWTASHSIAAGEPAALPRSGGLTGSFNR